MNKIIPEKWEMPTKIDYYVKNMPQFFPKYDKNVDDVDALTC